MADFCSGLPLKRSHERQTRRLFLLALKFQKYTIRTIAAVLAHAYFFT